MRTPFLSSSPAGPFGSDELRRADGALPPHGELNRELAMARALEDLGRRESGAPAAPGDFADRVMAAIAAEPSPAPLRLAAAALGRSSARQEGSDR